MPGYRFRLGSFSSHSSRNSNHDSLLGQKTNGVKYEIKLAVLGKTGVGKTAIIHRFLYDQFPEKHKETIDEVYLNELELVKGVDTRLTLDILDMGGGNEFPAMQKIGISNSNAFILVYSIDDSESFEEVRRLRDLILEIKLEKHIAKYSSTNDLQQLTTNKPDTLNNHQLNAKQQPINNSISSVKKEDLKIDQRRHSLNQINLDLNRHLNHLNNLNNLNNLNGKLNGSQLNDRLNSLNNQLNNQQLHNNQTSKRRHHFHHHKHSEKTKKPYILTNINQRYKLSENLKMINERRKSLTNSAKLIDFKSKLGDISEINNDIYQPTTADILCLRPSKLQTTSLPIYEQKIKEQTQLKKDKIANLAEVDEEEERQKYTNNNKGRRRSSFLLSPDSNSSSSCSESDSECESSDCNDSCCSSKSSRSSSITDLSNPKLDQNKENQTAGFKHVNLKSYKSKLESLKEQQERLQMLNESIPAFESPVIVVVGNKSDLECKRKIVKDVAENIVAIDWENGFLECSAKNNYNMTEIFKEMLKQSKLPFIVSNALDSQKNRRRSLPAYPSNLAHLKEPTFRTKRNSCALS